MNTRKIKKYIFKLLFFKKKKRRAPLREMISIRETNRKCFKKRKKKIVSGILRKFSIPIGKINLVYYSTAGGVVLVGTCIFVLVGPFFNIKDIYITRGNTNVNIDLAYESIDSIRGKKIFTLDTSHIEKLLLQRQKSIQKINTKLQLPARLNIEITSYDSIFQTHIHGNLYNILQNGSVIPSVNEREFPYIHIYNDDSSISSIPDYKKIYDSKYIESIEYLKNSLIENIIQLQIESLHYYVHERELIIVLKSGGELIFDLTKNLSDQIKRLVIFHNEGGDITKKNLIYTDLRINNKVFFCDTSTEFLCRLHLKNIYGEKKKDILTPIEN